jgi:hypothetical protein
MTHSFSSSTCSLKSDLLRKNSLRFKNESCTQHQSRPSSRQQTKCSESSPLSPNDWTTKRHQVHTFIHSSSPSVLFSFSFSGRSPPSRGAQAKGWLAGRQTSEVALAPALACGLVLPTRRATNVLKVGWKIQTSVHHTTSFFVLCDSSNISRRRFKTKSSPFYV